MNDTSTLSGPAAGAAQALRRAVRVAGEGLVERAALAELVVLACVAREHLLVVGPPGTAKSEAVRRISAQLGGRYFEYLLGRFTEPSEIYGPVDLRLLREGVVQTETAGMLPEAEVAFLDEVFLGSTAILNTLLGVLNERVFRRGHTVMRCPLRVCVGASNDIPEDPALAAFADRFLLRSFVQPLPDPLLEDLLRGGWEAFGPEGPPAATVDDVDTLADVVASADMGPVRPVLAQAIRLLRSAGIGLTDRRAVKMQKLVAAAAALGGRRTPGRGDLWPILFAVPGAEGQLLAREVLADLLADSHSEVAPAAAAEASRGPRARAHALLEAGQALLATPPEEGQDPQPWMLKLEGIAREIDAGFDAETLPEALASLRTEVVAALPGAEDG